MLLLEKKKRNHMLVVCIARAEAYSVENAEINRQNCNHDEAFHTITSSGQSTQPLKLTIRDKTESQQSWARRREFGRRSPR